MNALYFVMSQTGGKLLLNLEETANVIGYELSTAHSKIAKGEFPVPMRKQGNKWFADARDVANFLDEMRAQAHKVYEAMRGH
jgi:predicted site-specific integrase-resolvase